jgi:hypothetical protein
MKNLSRKDDLGFTGQGMGETPRMDKAFKECGNTPRMNWQASQCYEEGCRLERELNQANAIIKKCLCLLPVGYIPNHTPESLPDLIRSIFDHQEDYRNERDQAIRERDQARSNVKPMGEVTIARNGYIQEIEDQRDQAIKERDRAQVSLRTLIELHEREIETGEPITGEDWEIAGYAITKKKL